MSQGILRAKKTWTPLPPLTLHGVETDWVEDIDHYICRVLRCTGMSSSSLRSLIQPDCPPSSNHFPDLFHSTVSTLDRLHRLEDLAGADDLRCGTILSLSNILNLQLAGRSPLVRRWCVMCYVDWDEDTCWEPMIWRFGPQSRCPKHGCLLEEKCRSCGRSQSRNVRYRDRDRCYLCKAPLGAIGCFNYVSAYDQFSEACCRDMVMQCSDPASDVAPSASMAAYVDALRADFSTSDELNAPTAHELSLSKQYTLLLKANPSSKVSARRLIELCALRGVMPSKVMVAPIDAATSLFGPCEWRRPVRAPEMLPKAHSCHKPPLTTTGRLQRFKQLTTQLVANQGAIYLPLSRFILKACGLARNIVIENVGDDYRRYGRLYEDQGSVWTRTHCNRTFELANRRISAISNDGFTDDSIAQNAISLARDANVVLASAIRCLRAALLVKSIMKNWQDEDAYPVDEPCIQEKTVTAESDSREAYQASIQATVSRLFWLSASSQDELESLADHGVDREVCTRLVKALVPIGYLAIDPPGVFHGIEAIFLLRLCWLYADASVLLGSDTTATIWVLRNLKDVPLGPPDLEVCLASAAELIGKIQRTREFIL